MTASLAGSGIQADYIVVGAGAAGCVLANRLSADPSATVLLVEAGDQDDNPLIAMPRGFAQLLGDPDLAWHYPIRPFGRARAVEHWVRGRTLGGSSSVNGMIYNRGGAADYDALARRSNHGWGWSNISAAFRAIEDNPFGASPDRGAGGPLRLSTAEHTDPLLEHVIESGTGLGWRRVRDLNASDDERIGYAMATIHGGERCNAARAFLRPVADRANLTIAVRTAIDRLAIEDGRVSGVLGRRDGHPFRAAAAREVILAAGSLQSPKLLQLSGIAPADTLRDAGVEVMVDSPNVGRRLREHRVFVLQYRLSAELGYNRLLGSEDGLAAAAREYQQSRTGVLAAPSFDLVAFFKTRPDLDRPDAQIQVAPFSVLPPEPGHALRVEAEPGMMCIGYLLRPDSEGSVRITSASPDAPLDIDANYLATAHDRRTSVEVFRGMRRLCATDPLARHIEAETAPGPAVQTDPEILDAGLTHGGCGYHAIGTCAMGSDPEDVVDARLRVRGVTGLRVVDASVLPIMVSGNLNGPVCALAWRAADLIADGSTCSAVP